MKHIFLLFSMILGVSNLYGQKLTVRGTVTALSNGDPLVGVNVLIKGKNTGTVTDIYGGYIIDVPSAGKFFFRDDPILIFSYPGLETQEIKVEGQPRLDVQLKISEKKEIPVIETGTAINQSEDHICFSVGCLAHDLLSPVPTPQLGLGLQGKIPGLRVNPVSGQPGQGVFFQLRGANSIANGQQPLILLDGVYLNGSTLADINPDDIEKIEVLKGSAGAALYGSRAANGVIQFFTKRGKGLDIGETKIIYRGEFGYTQEVNHYQLNQFTNREVINSDGPQPILGNPTETDIHNNELPNLQNYQEDILFQRGLFHSNYLSVQGRSQSTSFLASIQRTGDEGIIQSTDGYTRNAFRMNVDHQVSNKLDFQGSSMYSTSSQELLTPISNGPGSYLANVLFLTPIFNLDANNEEDGSPFDWDIDNTGSGVTNPLYDRANAEQFVNRTRLIGSFRANLHTNDWLTFSYWAGVDRSTNEFEHFIEKGYLSTNVPGVFGNQVINGPNSNGGGIHRTRRVNNAFVSSFDITARKSIGDFNTSIKGSFLYEDLRETFNEGIGENLAVRNTRSLDNAQDNIFIASEEQSIVAYSGFLISDIDYQNKYSFSGLFRREGSSLFGLQQRWANYYRLSAAYKVSEDIKIKGIQELKLRAAVGTAGIRPTFEQRFETLTLINGTTTKNTLGNDALRPAKSIEREIGINMTFLKAFNLEFNYAQVSTSDQILFVPLTASAGFSGQWQNAGTLKSNALEFALNTDVKRLLKIKGKNFKWDLLTTFNRVRQKVDALGIPSYTTGPGILQSSLFLIEEGMPLGTMIGEVFATDVEQLADQENINPTDYTVNSAGYLVRQDQVGTPEERPYKLVDARGNPLIQQIGNTTPDFRMGFANIIQFKGFRFYTLFDWKKGGDVYNMTKQWLYGDRRHADLSKYEDVADGFFTEAGLFNGQIPNNHFVEKASFFMLREASFSYTFDENQLRNIFGNSIESITLNFIGRNLFTKTDYSGFHPDVSSPPRDENTLTNRIQNDRGSDRATPNGDPSLFAVDAFNYPLRKSFTFSLQLTF